MVYFGGNGVKGVGGGGVGRGGVLGGGGGLLVGVEGFFGFDGQNVSKMLVSN